MPHKLTKGVGLDVIESVVGVDDIEKADEMTIEQYKGAGRSQSAVFRGMPQYDAPS